MRTRSTPFPRRTGLALLVATLVGGTAALTAGPAGAAPGAVSVSNGDLAAACAPGVLCRFENVGAPVVEVIDSSLADSGDGYLRLGTPTAADKAQVAMVGDGRLTAGDLLRSPLAYETYVEVASGVAAPSLNIGVLSTRVPKPDGTPSFTTLVWEPTYTGAPITPKVWQKWSPSTTTNGWWATGTPFDALPNKFGFVNYQASFAQAVAGVGPDAVVVNVGVNQGRGPAGLIAGVDLLAFGGRTIDFENPVSARAIAATAGDNQSTAAGTAFPTRLAATVTGGVKKTRPVPNTPVVFTVSGGSASFSGGATATATTGADGVATAPVLTAGTTPGPITVTARSGSGAATEALVSTAFSGTVTAAPPAPVTDLAVTVTAPASARPGQSVVATVTVTNKGAAAVARAATAVTLQGGLLVVSAPGSVGAAAGKNVAYVDGPLVPGASVTHKVTVVSARLGATEVRAATSAGAPEANLVNNVATAGVVVR
jgi:hypothetical protein